MKPKAWIIRASDGHLFVTMDREAAERLDVVEPLYSKTSLTGTKKEA